MEITRKLGNNSKHDFGRPPWFSGRTDSRFIETWHRKITYKFFNCLSQKIPSNATYMYMKNRLSDVNWSKTEKLYCCMSGRKMVFPLYYCVSYDFNSCDVGVKKDHSKRSRKLI